MRWVLALASVLAAVLPATASEEPPALQPLLDAAPPGSEVVVRGVVRGPVVVRRPLRIVGGPGAVVDGGGEGTVVRVESPGVYLGRLRIRNSGWELNTEDAGVYVGAPGAVLEDLVLEDVLFGLNLKQADGAVVRRVRISGKPLPLNRRGDAVRLWYSQRVTLTDVEVDRMRDVLLWFTQGSVLHRLRVRGSRYGVHYMYAHSSPLLDSTLEDNAVGAYIMYSKNVRVEGSRFLHNRDVPGVGLAFKESDVVLVRRNAVVGNAVGVYLDATSMDGDGVGDFPYRLRRWFESVIDAVPAARILHRSAAVDALERAAQAVPLFPPQVVLEDRYPLVRAEVPAEFRHAEHSPAFAAASAAVAALGAVGVWLGRRPRSWEVGA